MTIDCTLQVSPILGPSGLLMKTDKKEVPNVKIKGFPISLE